jgi:hypothetical protein
VTVRIEGAVVAPHRADGRSWNGGLWDLAGGALQGVGGDVLPKSYNDLLSSLASMELAGVERPSVFGDALLEGSDGKSVPAASLATRDNPVDDFAVAWPTPAVFSNVDLASDVRIRVEAWNKNDHGDDIIGVAELNSADLAAARDSRRPYPVNVAGQTNNQLLYVTASVQAESSP